MDKWTEISREGLRGYDFFKYLLDDSHELKRWPEAEFYAAIDFLKRAAKVLDENNFFNSDENNWREFLGSRLSEYVELSKL